MIRWADPIIPTWMGIPSRTCPISQMPMVVMMLVTMSVAMNAPKAASTRCLLKSWPTLIAK